MKNHNALFMWFNGILVKGRVIAYPLAMNWKMLNLIPELQSHLKTLHNLSLI